MRVLIVIFSIVISPYFVSRDELDRFFSNLVRRRVRVRILTNSLAANDVPMVHAGYMRYREDLLRGGIELYEYQPTVIADKLQKKKSGYVGSSRASLHTNSFAIDKHYLFVDSCKLDPSPVSLNTEMGVVFEAPVHQRP